MASICRESNGLGLGCPCLKITVNEQFILGKLLFGEFCFHLNLLLGFTYSATISGHVSALMMAQKEQSTNHLGHLLYVIIDIVPYIPSLLLPMRHHCQVPCVIEQSTLDYFIIHGRKTPRNMS